AAPVWTARILADPAAAGDPADIDAAWQWWQLDCWVRQALGGQTPAQLQARLEELSVRRRRGIAELVSERAWRRPADNLGGPQQLRARRDQVREDWRHVRPALADGNPGRAERVEGRDPGVDHAHGAGSHQLPPGDRSALRRPGRRRGVPDRAGGGAAARAGQED